MNGSVPALYPVAIAPALIVLVAGLVFDVVRERERSTWGPRVGLAIGACVLSLLLIADVSPPGAAALLLAAVLGYEIASARAGHVLMAGVLVGLLATAWVELVMRGHGVAWIACAALGGALGAILARRGRKALLYVRS